MPDSHIPRTPPARCSHCGDPFAPSPRNTWFGPVPRPGTDPDTCPVYHLDRDECRAAGGLPPKATTRYCTGPRCADCEPPDPADPYGEDDCCEATCGCCPRTEAHGHCVLYPGSQDGAHYCDQHGEGTLQPLDPHTQTMSDLLHHA